MKLGKMERLDIIVSDLISLSRGTIASCVVTNERGLVVAGKTTDGSSNETLAAMISLLSDVAVRVNSNLGFGHPKSATIKGLGVSIQIREFLVKNKQFRIGAVTTEQERRYCCRGFTQSTGRHIASSWRIRSEEGVEVGEMFQRSGTMLVQNGNRELSASGRSCSEKQMPEHNQELVEVIQSEMREGLHVPTNQNLAETTIKDQRDFLKRVIESLTHPFYVIDAKTHKITMANKAANLGDIGEDSTCYSLTHRRNEPCNGIEHPCPLQEVKMTKKPVVVEHQHYDNNGEIRYLEVHAYPVFDSFGNVTQMIEYDLDVTEQKWIEKQLEIESRRARLYLDLLAHDITNQLQIIWSCTELINEITLLPESHEVISSFIRNIEESVKKCRSMILRAKSTEQLPLTPLFERDLKKVIYECVETVSEKQDEFNAIITIDVRKAHVLADKFLEQLLECLIENAVKHNSKDTKSVWIKLKQEGMSFEIHVADNGPGLEDSVKKRIFNPLHRFGGMGLHISSEIAEKYGGGLKVRDRVVGQPNSGVEFVLWLPKIGSTQL
jgi:signal transduction histidine kinase/predicted regulator of Ras-like GTPase activity (Roadblock/LC7/MglB family)